MNNQVGVSSNQSVRQISVGALMTAIVLFAVSWTDSPTLAGEQKAALSVLTAAPLDGRTFRTSIVRTSAEKVEEGDQFPDQLEFRDGKFSSMICKRYNFSAAPYWVRREGDQVHFLAELTSPTDGKMVWKGTIKGESLEGTMHWTKKRWYWTIDTEHNIRGTLGKAVQGAETAAD